MTIDNSTNYCSWQPQGGRVNLLELFVKKFLICVLLQHCHIKGFLISIGWCMSAQAKAFIDRTVLFRLYVFMFQNKLGGGITGGGSRNGGQELTIQEVHAATIIHDMIIVGDGDHFGGATWANHPDGYEDDETGISTAKNLGRRMSEVASMIQV